MAEALHLLQAVRNIDDRAALSRQPCERDEELVRLLRCEHRSRLVHDEQLRLLQQAAHDLDPLALTHRKVGHHREWLKRQAIIARHAGDALRQFLHVEGAGHGERDVLGNGERFEQREMLKHHADAQLARRRRAGDGDRLAHPAELAAGGLQRAIDHFDEGGFAGPVLTEEGMYLAGLHLQRHVVIGFQRAENLGDVERFEEIFHAVSLHFWPPACLALGRLTMLRRVLSPVLPRTLQSRRAAWSGCRPRRWGRSST